MIRKYALCCVILQMRMLPLRILNGLRLIMSLGEPRGIICLQQSRVGYVTLTRIAPTSGGKKIDDIHAKASLITILMRTPGGSCWSEGSTQAGFHRKKKKKDLRLCKGGCLRKLGTL